MVTFLCIADKSTEPTTALGSNGNCRTEEGEACASVYTLIVMDGAHKSTEEMAEGRHADAAESLSAAYDPITAGKGLWNGVLGVWFM